MVVRTILRQPEKSAQRDPDGKGWIYYYCGKEGHLKWDCPQFLRCPQVHVWSIKDHTGRETALRGSLLTEAPEVGLSGQSELKLSGGPHTRSHPNYTWGTLGINNCGGLIIWFPLGHQDNSVLIDALGPLSPQSSTAMGLSGQAKYYFCCHLNCNWDSVLFSHEFLIVSEFPSPLLGRDILSKVHASVFMKMEPSVSLPLVEQNVNPRVWADGKTMGWAQNTIPVYIKLRDPHIFPHQKQYPLKLKIKEGLKTYHWKFEGAGAINSL